MSTPLFNIETTLNAYERHLDFDITNQLVLKGGSNSVIYLSNRGIVLDKPMINTWIIQFGNTRFIEDCSVVKVKEISSGKVSVTESKVCPAFRQILHYCTAIRNNHKRS